MDTEENFVADYIYFYGPNNAWYTVTPARGLFQNSREGFQGVSRQGGASTLHR